MINPRYKQILIEIILLHLPQARVYFFGSRARNDERAGSDIDIAVDDGKPIPFVVILAIHNDIDATTIPIKVDLVDMHSVDKAVKENILREGIEWKS